MRLVFTEKQIPRSTTRAQWRELHRWRRTTERRLELANIRAIENLVVYGSAMPEALHARALDRIVNPPLMIYPEPTPRFRAVERVDGLAGGIVLVPQGPGQVTYLQWGGGSVVDPPPPLLPYPEPSAIELNDPQLVGLFTKIGRELCADLEDAPVARPPDE